MSIRCNGIGRKPQAWRTLVQPGLHIIFTLICLREIACGAVLIGLACALHSMFLMIVAEMAVIGAFALIALINAARSGIYAAALYRDATDCGDTPGFDSRSLETAFLAGY